jgi:glutathione peroxidase
MTPLHDFEARTITGVDRQLAEYRGSVVLVVNTASKCGLTPQFEGLEQLYSGLRAGPSRPRWRGCWSSTA